MNVRAANTLESGKVVRYHAATSIGQKQSIAEHSWGVAVIALYLVGDRMTPNLYRACLLHDTAEAYTGDVPFNVKREFADVKARFDELEKLMQERFLLPMPELTAWENSVLKMADTLEGYIWAERYEHPSDGGIVSVRWTYAFNNAKTKFRDLLGEEVILAANTLLIQSRRVNLA
jgi:5'-deoxynucleotidase YfbR-like HD superfamily hydrolase